MIKRIKRRFQVEREVLVSINIINLDCRLSDAHDRDQLNSFLVCWERGTTTDES